MKKALIVLLICAPFQLYCQNVNFDHLITEKFIPCNNVAQSAPEIIKNFYQKKQYDSLTYFLDYYDQKCSRSSNTFILRTKLELQQRTFETDNIDKDFLKKLFPTDAQIRFLRNKKTNTYQYNTNNQKPKLDNVLKLIEENTDRSNRNLDETFLIEFLNEKTLLLKDLKSKKFEKSKLAQLYKTYEKEMNKISEARFGAIFGIVSSQQKIKYISPSPSLGLEMGIRKDKQHISGVLTADFGEPKNDYLVLDNDSLINTDVWSQVYLGAEYGYEFFRPKFAQFILWGGIGYNSMNNRFKDEQNNIDNISKGSVNLNIGLGVEKKFKGWYLAIQGKYHYANYRYQQVETPVYGNHISLRLIAGFRSTQSAYHGMYLPYGHYLR